MPGHYELEPSDDEKRIVVTVSFPGLDTFTFTIRTSSLVDDPDEADRQIGRIVAYEIRQRDPRPASEILLNLPAEGGISRGRRGAEDSTQ